MRKDDMRNPLAPRYDEHRWDRLFFWGLAVVGILIAILTPEGAGRPYFAALSCICGLVFILVYRQYDWRTTYAGRATMLAMCVYTLYTANATVIHWWPNGEFGYPYWENITEVVYVTLAVAALYKLRALTRRDSSRRRDPTTDKA